MDYRCVIKPFLASESRVRDRYISARLVGEHSCCRPIIYEYPVYGRVLRSLVFKPSEHRGNGDPVVFNEFDIIMI